MNQTTFRPLTPESPVSYRRDNLHCVTTTRVVAKIFNRRHNDMVRNLDITDHANYFLADKTVDMTLQGLLRIAWPFEFPHLDDFVLPETIIKDLEAEPSHKLEQLLGLPPPNPLPSQFCYALSSLYEQYPFGLSYRAWVERVKQRFEVQTRYLTLGPGRPQRCHLVTQKTYNQLKAYHE